MGKMTRPNFIYNDASINNSEYTFIHCERWRLEKRKLEAKVGICIVDNFCDAILYNEENWNSIASYTEALQKSKKFDLDKGRRMDIKTSSQVLLCNPDADMDIKWPNGQTYSISN